MNPTLQISPSRPPDDITRAFEVDISNACRARPRRAWGKPRPRRPPPRATRTARARFRPPNIRRSRYHPAPPLAPQRVTPVDPQRRARETPNQPRLLACAAGQVNRSSVARKFFYCRMISDVQAPSTVLTWVVRSRRAARRTSTLLRTSRRERTPGRRFQPFSFRAGGATCNRTPRCIGSGGTGVHVPRALQPDQ